MRSISKSEVNKDRGTDEAHKAVQFETSFGWCKFNIAMRSEINHQLAP